MASIELKHVFNCSPETFWDKIFFTPEYNERMVLEGLGFPSFKPVSEESTDAEILRVFEVVPKMGPMPGPIKKLVGSSLTYREEGRFEKQAKIYHLKIVPSTLSNKLDIQGEITAEPLPDGKMNRVLNCRVKASIFGVGGMLEKQLMGDLNTSYAAAAVFTNRYIEEKGL